jgi:hypothetical protein
LLFFLNIRNMSLGLTPDSKSDMVVYCIVINGKYH